MNYFTFRRTLTIIPFSSETPPPLVWERSAPSQWGSFRCGMGSSCRGWCVHGHGKYAYASLGPCSPGCAQSPESPHPNPTRSQCGMKWSQQPNSGKAAFMQAKLQSQTEAKMLLNSKLNWKCISLIVHKVLPWAQRCFLHSSACGAGTLRFSWANVPESSYAA